MEWSLRQSEYDETQFQVFIHISFLIRIDILDILVGLSLWNHFNEIANIDNGSNEKHLVSLVN